MSPAPRRLVAGLSGVALLVLACAIGPLLLPPLAGFDPRHAALLPPGSSAAELVLRDGSVVVAPGAVLAGGTWRIPDRRGEQEIRGADVQRVRRHRFWLGSDRFGRDVARQLLLGGRLSLMVAGFALVVALVLGLAVGLAAATGGAVVDALLMRLVDALLAFPVLFLLILVASLVRPGALLLVAYLGLTSWMGLARLVRGQVLSLRSRPFVLAARAAGSRWHRIWRLHYGTNLVGPVSQDAALRLGDLVLAEATLSFLGLGLPPDVPSWGAMVAEGHRVLVEGWWLATFPGLAIAGLVISLALIGDGLQQATAAPASGAGAAA